MIENKLQQGKPVEYVHLLGCTIGIELVSNSSDGTVEYVALDDQGSM